MRFRTLFALLLFIGCATAPSVTAPSVSTPPPPQPPPERHVIQAVIFGNIREPDSSTPAAYALVTATVGCTGAAESAQVFTDEQGDFQVTLEANAGSELVACVGVNATHGGASGTSTIENVTFRAKPERFRTDVALERTPPLTPGEAEDLLQSFVRLLNGDDAGQVILSTYVRGGPEALRAAIEDYRSILGEKISAVPTTSEFGTRYQRKEAVLRGSKGKALSLSVYQEAVRRFYSPLIYYSLYSRLFAASFSRLVSSGDEAGLARLLTADDLDYPVESARRVIAKYKPAFETRGGSYELIAVDERLNTLTYRLTWQGEKETASADIVLRYGDGLLGLVE